MNINLKLSLCLLLLPSSSFGSEGISEDADVATSQWLHERAVEQADAASNFATGKRASTPGKVSTYSLDDYPAPEAVKQNIARGVAVRNAGISTVPPDRIPSADRLLATPHSAARSEAELTRLLTAPPSNLTKTPLANARLVSSYFVGRRMKNGTSTGISRVFDLPGRGVVVFDENDYVTAGAQIVLAKESFNAEVNGTPAISYATQSADGRGEAVISWVTPRRSYRLTLLTNNSKSLPEGQKLLMNVATRIVE